MNKQSDKHLRYIGYIVLAAALTSCAQQRDSRIPCTFKYNSVVERKIAIPAMKAEIGDSYVAYDTSDPAILISNGYISLIFRFKSDAIDTPSYILRLEPCSLRVISSFETNVVLAE